MVANDQLARIIVSVQAQYLNVEAAESISSYIFSYKVSIYNQQPTPVYVFSRQWVAVDSNGNEIALTDPNLLMRQIDIQPGDTYVHQGTCRLATTTGIITGLVGLQFADGEIAWQPIPRKLLSCPVRLVSDNTLIVKNGIITATPKNIFGFKTTDSYILKPIIATNQLQWQASGKAVELGYAK